MDKRIYDIIKNRHYRINAGQVVYWIDEEQKVESLESIVQYMYEKNLSYGKVVETTIDDMKTRIIKQQWNDDILPYEKISLDAKFFYGYKFARSEKDDKLGNSTPYIKHDKNIFVEDDTDGLGLHFFTNPELLVDYMTYGDRLIKIKIDKAIYKSMFVKESKLNQGSEYSCTRYYVHDILDLRERETLDFILDNISQNKMLFPNESINHLKKIGTQKVLIEFFTEKLNEKIK